MHNALNRTMRRIANGIRQFMRLRLQFKFIRNKLPRNGILRISRIDELCHLRGDGNGIMRANLLNRRQTIRTDQSGLQQMRCTMQSCLAQNTVLTTGVQITSSILLAPVASIISLSNPSAIPLAGGI